MTAPRKTRTVFDAAQRAAEAAVYVVAHESILRAKLEDMGFKVSSITEGKHGTICEVVDKKAKQWSITVAYDGHVRTSVAAG